MGITKFCNKDIYIHTVMRKRFSANALLSKRITKVVILMPLLLLIVFFLYSWGRYSLGSYHFNRIVHGKSASLPSRVAWVHPAKKVIIDDPEILNCFSKAMKESSNLDFPVTHFNNKGNLVFEFSDGSYFTLNCNEKWNTRENKIILGYNLWWKNETLEWGWPTKECDLKISDSYFSQINDFFNSSIVDNCHQIMHIEATGKVK